MRTFANGFGRAALVAAALALSAIPSCAPAPPGSSVDAGDSRSGAVPIGGRFVFPLPIEPATLNFVTGSDVASVLVQRLVADSLVDHDARMRVVPRLAARWEFSPDGRTLTFHLRPGVRFHDGTPLTSEDVKFTWERIMDPESRAVGRMDAFLPVASVETPDPLTVRVLYREPYAPALRAWEVPILPAKRYRGADFATAAENRAPIGSGPFRFVSWEAGRSIVLEANKDYWAGRPPIDSFVFQITPSPETALLGLLEGSLDYARMPAAQWVEKRREASFSSRFRDVSYMPLFFYYIAWRSDGSNPFFSDPVVRRAMTMAIDREGYVRSVLKGLGRVIGTPYDLLLPIEPADGATAGRQSPAPLPFDPVAAAALLDQAGWRIDPGTGLRTRAGRAFRFTLLVFTGGEDHVQFSQVAQENLRRIGVAMSIERLDWQTLWSRLKNGTFEAALSGTLPSPDPDAVYGMLHSSQIRGGQNYAAFHDPDVDGWLDVGRRTLDPVARETLYRHVEARLGERQPYTCLFAPMVAAALRAKFDGVEPSPQGILGYHPGAAGLHLAAGSQ